MMSEGLYARPLTSLTKGVPNGVSSMTVSELHAKKWNVLKDDLPLPLALLKASALQINSQWMKTFLEKTGARICPHGKTTMSPQLFDLQLQDGAWGITVANLHQLKVARAMGLQRILMANQLIGKQAIDYVFSELARDPQFEFYCLVDSVAAVEQLVAIGRHYERPLNVFLEIGYSHGRCGCRDSETAMRVASAVHASQGVLRLCGIEAYEGNIHHASEAETLAFVKEYLAYTVHIASVVYAAGYFFNEENIFLTAGGTAYYDLAIHALQATTLQATVLTRSGTYLLHDSGYYKNHYQHVLERDAVAASITPRMTHAIEIWAYVQSLPEPGLAILNFGKRDASYDVTMPIPLYSVNDEEKTPLSHDYKILKMDDQHAFLSIPTTSILRVGDKVGCGISHPCTTFDKWQWLPIVDDDYTVIDGVLTYF